MHVLHSVVNTPTVNRDVISCNLVLIVDTLTYLTLHLRHTPPLVFHDFEEGKTILGRYQYPFLDLLFSRHWVCFLPTVNDHKMYTSRNTIRGPDPLLCIKNLKFLFF